MKAYVRPAHPSDIGVIATDLRAEDVAELKAMSGNEPHTALRAAMSVPGSTVRVACLPNELPVAIFGVAPALLGVGMIWMVATNGFEQVHRQFAREAEDHLRDLCEGYSVVFNFVDARNKVHLRWLQWAGFVIINRHEQMGVQKRPFFEFVKILDT